MNDAPNDVAASAVDYEDLMAPWAYNASAVTLFFIGFFGFFLNLFVIALMCKDMQVSGSNGRGRFGPFRQHDDTRSN